MTKTINIITGTTCPKCNEKITYLYYSGLEGFSGDFDGKNWEENDYKHTVKIEYECPECNEVLFNNDQEAINFFKKEMTK